MIYWANETELKRLKDLASQPRDEFKAFLDELTVPVERRTIYSWKE